MDRPQTKYKRVSITLPNLELAEKTSAKLGKDLAEYLDYLINRSIVEDFNKTRPPLYVWKS